MVGVVGRYYVLVLASRVLAVKAFLIEWFYPVVDGRLSACLAVSAGIIFPVHVPLLK